MAVSLLCSCEKDNDPETNPSDPSNGLTTGSSYPLDGIGVVFKTDGKFDYLNLANVRYNSETNQVDGYYAPVELAWNNNNLKSNLVELEDGYYFITGDPFAFFNSFVSLTVEEYKKVWENKDLELADYLVAENPFVEYYRLKLSESPILFEKQENQYKINVDKINEMIKSGDFAEYAQTKHILLESLFSSNPDASSPM